MAFIAAPGLSASRTAHARRALSSRRAPAMTAPPPPSGTSSPVPASSSSSSAESNIGYEMNESAYELDTDALKDKAMGVVTDVGARPLFYGKILGYAIGGLVSFTVLRAVVSAVDSLPVLPGALELIGLGYTVWFVWRYVLFKESREELLEEIEDFLGRAKPGSQ